MGKAKVSRSGDALNRSLFALQPIFRKCLNEVQRACVDIANTELLAVDMHVAHGLTALENSQGEQSARCRMLMRVALIERKRRLWWLAKSRCDCSTCERHDGTGRGGVPVPKNLPTSPATSPRAPLKNSLGTGSSYTEVAATNSHCRMLARFIRLCELQIVESHMDSALNSVQLLLARMRIAAETAVDETIVGLPNTRKQFPGETGRFLAVQLAYYEEQLLNRTVEGVDIAPVYELELHQIGALAALHKEHTPTASQVKRLVQSVQQATPQGKTPRSLAYAQ